jgi:hypothetical protein
MMQWFSLGNFRKRFDLANRIKLKTFLWKMDR